MRIVNIDEGNENEKIRLLDSLNKNKKNYGTFFEVILNKKKAVKFLVKKNDNKNKKNMLAVSCFDYSNIVTYSSSRHYENDNKISILEEKINDYFSFKKNKICLSVIFDNAIKDEIINNNKIDIVSYVKRIILKQKNHQYQKIKYNYLLRFFCCSGKDIHPKINGFDKKYKFSENLPDLYERYKEKCNINEKCMEEINKSIGPQIIKDFSYKKLNNNDVSCSYKNSTSQNNIDQNLYKSMENKQTEEIFNDDDIKYDPYEDEDEDLGIKVDHRPRNFTTLRR